MKRTLLLILPLALVACGGGGTHDTEAPEAPPAERASPDPVAARIEGGVQVVEIEAGPAGYEPSAVAFEAGIPARLVFTRTVESACASQVQIPAFDVPATDLPLGEPVAVEFTPTESGDFTFVCGMDMQRGSLLVQS